MSPDRRKRQRPVWVIGDLAGGTAVTLVLLIVALLMGLVAALIGSVWAWVPFLLAGWSLVFLAMVAIGVAIASIAYHRRHIPGFNHDDAGQGDGT